QRKTRGEHRSNTLREVQSVFRRPNIQHENRRRGEYLIKNVPPGIYEGLTARVFDTRYYVFATSGFISSAKYELEPDRTFFAPDSNLFKSDLKLLSPKAG